jgi:hypothetical protein
MYILSPRDPDSALQDKVEQQWVVVVNLIQPCTVFTGDVALLSERAGPDQHIDRRQRIIATVVPSR